MVIEGCPHGPRELVGDDCLQCKMDKISNEEVTAHFAKKIDEIVKKIPPCPRCSRLTVEGVSYVIQKGIVKHRQSPVDKLKDIADDIAQAVLRHIRGEER